MKDEEGVVPQLHLFAQNAYHDPAYVVGDRAGLEALARAIKDALSGKPAVAEVFANDGEGYACTVALVTDEQMEAMPLAYTADYARDDAPLPRWIRDVPWRRP